eukprot:3213155-Pyramimonas_sp.AAC.1
MGNDMMTPVDYQRVPVAARRSSSSYWTPSRSRWRGQLRRWRRSASRRWRNLRANERSDLFRCLADSGRREPIVQSWS